MWILASHVVVMVVVVVVLAFSHSLAHSPTNTNTDIHVLSNTAYRTMPIQTRRGRAAGEAEAAEAMETDQTDHRGENEKSVAVAASSAPATTTPTSSEDLDVRITLAHLVFECQRSDRERNQGKGEAPSPTARQQLMDVVTSRSMGPYYEYVCKTLGWEVDAGLLSTMKAKIAEDVAGLDADVKSAEEEEGDVEVKDMLVKKALYLANVGDVAAAEAAFEVAAGKTAGSGPRMDLSFEQLRMYFSVGDWRSYKKCLDTAWDLCNSGGDWERKNNLKVYVSRSLIAPTYSLSLSRSLALRASFVLWPGMMRCTCA